MNATKINWSSFKLKNENYTKSFEELCYHLFCRKYGLIEGIRTNHNQVGIETEPIADKYGNLVGFQSKFFDNKISDPASVRQIVESIKKTKKSYPNLHTLVIYTHHSFGSTVPAYKVKIEKEAGQMNIQWFMSSNFEVALFQPANLDLAQLYFGLAQEIDFLKNSLSPEMFTFLSSPYCLDIPLTDQNGSAVSDLHGHIRKSRQKIFLLTGSPGSGKSISMYKLFQRFAAMDTADTSKMIGQLAKQKAIPVLINLRNCITENIENIIRGRQNDNKIASGPLGFIYLFDGIDELSEQLLDYVLSYIQELSHKKNTVKIIFSCRSGSFNKLKVKSNFQADELTICRLDLTHIKTFFQARRNSGKSEKLQNFINAQSPILLAADDILLISLLFDTVEELHENSTIIDLLDKKVHLLLKNNTHRKNIEQLDLLNPKEEKLILLHEEIAYHFHQKFQFRFSLPELQIFLANRLPQCGPTAINNLINYIIDLFFEHSFGGGSSDDSFIYQHRKYQEYFFAKKLKKEFDKKPSILRKQKVISNTEFFEDIFLPYLKSSYKEENDLIGFIKLNLIKLYSGNDSSWGGDEPYYLNSSFFLKALSAQSSHVFEQLYNDENIGVKEKIYSHLPPKEILKTFIDDFKKDKNNYDLEDKLLIIHERLSSLLEAAAVLHQNKRYLQASEILNRFKESIELFDSSKLTEYLRNSNRGQINDPYWKNWESLLYIRIFMENYEPKIVFEDFIEKNYSKFNDEQGYSFEDEQGKKKLINSFLRVILKFSSYQLASLVDIFKNFEIETLLILLASPQYLHIYFNDSALKKAIDKKIGKLETSTYKIFFKKLSGKKLTAAETDYSNKAYAELQSEYHSEFDIQRNNKLHLYALTAFNSEIFSFESIFKNYRKDFDYYHEISLYSSTFKEYIEILSDKGQLLNLIANFKKYNAIHMRHKDDKYFIYDFSALWAAIFSTVSIDDSEKKQLLKLFMEKNENVDNLEFFAFLSQMNSEKCKILLNRTALERTEKALKNSPQDMQESVDNHFKIALLYAGIDEQKAINHFTSGITNSLLKHGWRKDTIVCYSLVDALDIMWQNRWYNNEKLEKYTQKVYQLTIKAAEITDGKYTWRGPYYLIEIISKHNIKLAVKYRNKFKAKDHNYSAKLSLPIILSMIREGFQLNEIEKEINALPMQHNYLNHPSSEYRTARIKAYLSLAVSNYLSEEEQKLAFGAAFQEISEAVDLKPSHIDWQNDLLEEISIFKTLCRKYRKTNRIPDYTPDVEKSNGLPEAELMQQLYEVKNRSQLKKWYKNFDRDVDSTVEHFANWEEIISRTFELNQNISIFLELLKRDYYPGFNYFTNNAKYYHLAVASALDSINTRQETLDFLFQNSGHDGFLNILKSYEMLRDQKTARLLFKHYVRFCDFLVN